MVYLEISFLLDLLSIFLDSSRAKCLVNLRKLFQMNRYVRELGKLRSKNTNYVMAGKRSNSLTQ